MNEVTAQQINDLFEKVVAASVLEMINAYPTIEELAGKYTFSETHKENIEILFAEYHEK